ncbi:MAG: DUF4118 domain-containing protein [Lachnospiraceae bacterium]|nr:DUF4118 domain-containing protein [Lachnospiraceae bacterium]
MKLLLTYLKRRNAIFTVLIMGTATFISFLFFRAFPENRINIALIYILALPLIARWTDRYRYGLCSAGLSALCINFLFTYP